MMTMAETFFAHMQYAQHTRTPTPTHDTKHTATMWMPASHWNPERTKKKKGKEKEKEKKKIQVKLDHVMFRFIYFPSPMFPRTLSLSKINKDVNKAAHVYISNTPLLTIASNSAPPCEAEKRGPEPGQEKEKKKASGKYNKATPPPTQSLNICTDPVWFVLNVPQECKNNPEDDRIEQKKSIKKYWGYGRREVKKRTGAHQTFVPFQHSKFDLYSLASKRGR